MRKSCAFCSCADILRQLVVIDVRSGPTRIADQEDAVVKAARVRIGNIGIGTFNPAGKVGRNEQVENSVHAVGCYALASLLRNEVRDIISGGWLFKCRKHRKDIGAHVGPLLACTGQRILRCLRQRGAFMFVMMMM